MKTDIEPAAQNFQALGANWFGSIPYIPMFCHDDWLCGPNHRPSLAFKPQFSSAFQKAGAVNRSASDFFDSRFRRQLPSKSQLLMVKSKLCHILTMSVWSQDLVGTNWRH
jgi:hypothetical protein